MVSVDLSSEARAEIQRVHRWWLENGHDVERLQRAIAWLRHQTTAYDSMSIPRVKGMRREVRRLLAERARALLARYRHGEAIDATECPLRLGLRRAS